MVHIEATPNGFHVITDEGYIRKICRTLREAEQCKREVIQKQLKGNKNAK